MPPERKSLSINNGFELSPKYTAFVPPIIILIVNVFRHSCVLERRCSNENPILIGNGLQVIQMHRYMLP